MKTVIRHLRRAALLDPRGGPGDGQLLEAFLGRRDETAFEALLRRHGPMVLGVCRRVLGNPDDADDAFQATFLVLVRKAATLRSRDLLGNWLYGVAYRTAMKARSMTAKRRAKEKEAGERSGRLPPADEVPAELLAQLDAELNRLPVKYRVPLALCELEGRSRKEVAKLLGLPEGTLSWRLAQAKKLLAQRLSRRGVAFSGGALAGVLCRNTVPHPLLTSTAKAGMAVATGKAATGGAVSAKVIALAEGAMKAMLLTKLKVAAWVVLLTVCVGTGVAYRAAAQAPAQGRFGTTLAARQAPDELEALRLEIEALRKELRATKERVKALEARAGTHTSSGAPKANSGTSSSVTISDPLADAEAAIKKVRQNPNDKEAAGALERALRVLTGVRDRMKTPEADVQGQKTGQELQRKKAALEQQQEFLRYQAILAAKAEEEEAKAQAVKRQRAKETADPVARIEKARRDQVTADLVSYAEGLLKKLHDNPNDMQAADALERTLKRLKEQRMPNQPKKAEELRRK
jgi:RNA polymerase sigma factor (sigma-70 family)